MYKQNNTNRNDHKSEFLWYEIAIVDIFKQIF